MNGRVAKKIRRAARRNWIEYVKAIRGWPFSVRLRFAWEILFSGKWK